MNSSFKSDVLEWFPVDPKHPCTAVQAAAQAIRCRNIINDQTWLTSDEDRESIPTAQPCGL